MTIADEPETALDIRAFPGEWINTNEGPREIDRVLLRTAEDRLYLRVLGHGHPGGADWGEIEVTDIYADSATSREGMSFTGEFTLGAMRVEVGVNLNQGLLVMAMFNTWTGTGRPNYFAREFFRQ